MYLQVHDSCCTLPCHQFQAINVPKQIRMSATAEYLTAAENRAHETTTILKMTLPTAATSSRARAIAKTFCAVVPALPSSCTRHCLIKASVLRHLSETACSWTCQPRQSKRCAVHGQRHTFALRSVLQCLQSSDHTDSGKTSESHKAFRDLSSH